MPNGDWSVIFYAVIDTNVLVSALLSVRMMLPQLGVS